MNILFLGKKDDLHTAAALQFCSSNFTHTESALSEWGEPFPEEYEWWQGDIIVSYLSRWIITPELLNRAKTAINFHPAPPCYRGRGGTNRALYDGAAEYGVTAHHITASVDSGPIIAVKRFPVLPSDDVASLTARTYCYQLALFYDVTSALLTGKLPSSDERWEGEPWTKKKLDDLAIISPDMPADEIARRVRATSFGPWKPRVVLKGHTFEHHI